MEWSEWSEGRWSKVKWSETSEVKWSEVTRSELGGQPSAKAKTKRQLPRAAGIRKVSISIKFVKKKSLLIKSSNTVLHLQHRTSSKCRTVRKLLAKKQKCFKKMQKVCIQLYTLNRKRLQCVELSSIPFCRKIPSRSVPQVSEEPKYGNLFFFRKMRKPKKRQYFDR